MNATAGRFIADRQFRVVRHWIAVSALMLTVAMAVGQETRTPRRPGEPAAESTAAAEPEAKKDAALPVPAETKVETKHDWTAGARAVHYTATAGTLQIKDDEEKVIGVMFYVAYTEDGAGRGRLACGCTWGRWGR